MIRCLVIGLAIIGMGCSRTTPPPPAPPAKSVAHIQAPASTPSLRASVPTPRPDTDFERKVFYYPNKTHYGDPPAGVEVVSLSTSDQLKLTAWFLQPPSDRPLVLYFHGNGGNVSALGEQFEVFRRARVGALAIDYRGFGDSEGEPSEEGLYIDGLAAYAEAVRQGVPPEQLVIHGRSLGGGVATYVAAERPCAGLILESTLTSAQDVARVTHGEKGARLVNGFDSLSRMSRITVPVLIIHGTADETIPCPLGRRLHQACPGSELWLVEGANHSNLRSIAGPGEVARRLDTFVSGLGRR